MSGVVARSWLAALVALAALGAVCEPGTIRVTNRPPDPVLVDADGALDRAGVEALIAAVERERGRRFVQHPTLELLAPDDPRIPDRLAAARALEPCPRAGVAKWKPDAAGRCVVAASLEWIECVAPPDLEEARRALRRLFDAQEHPALARAAPLLPGDPGVALRALLAASANGATAHDGATALDLLELDTIDVERQDVPGDACVAIADHFLSAQSDPDAAFRRPPLSTKQLVSPQRYRAGERPLLLLGPPPTIAGCSVAADESVGVARLLAALVARGGSLRGTLLAAWQGDRGVRYACDDGHAPWLYAAEFADAKRAAAFASEVARLLPDDFAGPSVAEALARRVVVSSRDLDAPTARAWASSLTTAELVGFRGVE